MLKDRKFWTGLLVGAGLMGSVALLQPISAAPTPAPAESAEAKSLKIIAGAMAKMIQNQNASQRELEQIRGNTESMAKGIRQLGEAQGFNPSN